MHFLPCTICWKLTLNCRQDWISCCHTLQKPLSLVVRFEYSFTIKLRTNHLSAAVRPSCAPVCSGGWVQGQPGIVNCSWTTYCASCAGRPCWCSSAGRPPPAPSTPSSGSVSVSPTVRIPSPLRSVGLGTSSGQNIYLKPSPTPNCIVLTGSLSMRAPPPHQHPVRPGWARNQTLTLIIWQKSVRLRVLTLWRLVWFDHGRSKIANAVTKLQTMLMSGL